MIYCLHGTVLDAGATWIVLDVGGVGYYVHTPHATTFVIRSTVSLHTAFRWSPEQGPALFGFCSAVERDLFNLLTSCSGVGPKLGVALLDALPAQTIVEALVRRDEKPFLQVSGVGQKKAELLVHALADKMEPFISHCAVQNCGEMGGATQALHELSLALQSLGYSRAEIRRACQAVGQLRDAEKTPFDQILRKALLMLTSNPQP